MTRGHGAMQILQVIFGQELPDTATSFAQQSFAVGVAAIGLAAFALVLALVEQVWRLPCISHVEVKRRPALPPALSPSRTIQCSGAAVQCQCWPRHLTVWVRLHAGGPASRGRECCQGVESL